MTEQTAYVGRTETGTVDAELEALIDKAGRDRVFARARTYGWCHGQADKWIWAGIAHEILAGKAPQLQPPRLDEAIFGFRLF